MTDFNFQILPACNNWSDCLWAYFKVLVDIEVEQVMKAVFQFLYFVKVELQLCASEGFKLYYTIYTFFVELQIHSTFKLAYQEEYSEYF